MMVRCNLKLIISRSLLGFFLVFLSGCGSSNDTDGTGATPSAMQALCAPSQATDSAASRTHHLAAVGCSLGAMDSATYSSVQQKWVGKTQAACNFFVMTALCQDGQCSKKLNNVMASDYGSFLKKNGWKEVKLSTLEKLFDEDADFDAIMQSAGTQSNSHGHVLIPVSMGANHQMTVAQGELGSAANEVIVDDAKSIMNIDGGMHIWVSE
jgi:hypothetical protein